jgi:hypothetical protein
MVHAPNATRAGVRLAHSPDVVAHRTAARGDLNVVPPGKMFLSVPSGNLNFSKKKGTTIPRDFFGPGSKTFKGNVALQGASVGEIDGFHAGDSSLVIERLGELDFGTSLPSTVTVDIDLVALSLASVEPITVKYKDGSTQQWDVAVTQVANPERRNDHTDGLITATRDSALGGFFDIFVELDPIIRFTRRDDSSVVIETQAVTIFANTGDNIRVQRVELLPFKSECPNQATLFSTPDGFWPLTLPAGGLTTGTVRNDKKTLSFEVTGATGATHGGEGIYQFPATLMLNGTGLGNQPLNMACPKYPPISGDCQENPGYCWMMSLSPASIPKNMVGWIRYCGCVIDEIPPFGKIEVGFGECYGQSPPTVTIGNIECPDGEFARGRLKIVVIGCKINYLDAQLCAIAEQPLEFEAEVTRLPWNRPGDQECTTLNLIGGPYRFYSAPPESFLCAVITGGSIVVNYGVPGTPCEAAGR